MNLTEDKKEEKRLKHTAEVRAYQKKNPAKVSAWVKKYQSKPENIEKVRAWKRAYYLKNKEKISLKRKEQRRLLKLNKV